MLPPYPAAKFQVVELSVSGADFKPSKFVSFDAVVEGTIATTVKVTNVTVEKTLPEAASETRAAHKCDVKIFLVQDNGGKAFVLKKTRRIHLLFGCSPHIAQFLAGRKSPCPSI